MPRIISLISERNIVFHVVEFAARLLRRRLRLSARLGLARLRRATLRAGVGTRLAAAFAAAEHLHHVAADLGRVAVLAFLVLPFARAQAALDIDLRALLQILARHLGEAPEERDAMPFGRFLHLAARLVLPLVGGGDTDVDDRLAARQIARLWIRSQIADDDDLVH